MTPSRYLLGFSVQFGCPLLLTAPLYQVRNYWRRRNFTEDAHQSFYASACSVLSWDTILMTEPRADGVRYNQVLFCFFLSCGALRPGGALLCEPALLAVTAGSGTGQDALVVVVAAVGGRWTAALRVPP